MDSDRRLRLRRALLGFVALLLISQLARSVAAELITGSAQPIESPSPMASPTGNPSVSAAETSTVSPTPVSPVSSAPPLVDTPPASNSAQTPLVGIRDSASVSATPVPMPSQQGPHALPNQTMTIRTPAAVKVDPRARSVFLPQIAAFGPANLLICMSTTQAVFDIAGQNQTDVNKGTLVTGDLSPTLLVSGVGSSPIELLNSQNGLRVIAPSGGIANKFITLSFIAVSEPSLNSALCGDGSPSNNRTIAIQSVGLNVDMLKGDVTLKK